MISEGQIYDGRPRFLKIDAYVEFLENLVRCDEVIRALDMANHPLGYFQGNPALEELKLKIYKNLITVFDYAGDADESLDVADDWLESNFNNTAQKLDVVLAEIERLDGAHVIEMCPGNGWLKSLLTKKGAKFTHEGRSINMFHHNKSDVTPYEKRIFISMETVEHLWSPEKELQHWYYKYAHNADSIIISTPLNTLNGGLYEIERDLGHLRTYSRQDLITLCTIFPMIYSWESLNTACQIVIGRKI